MPDDGVVQSFERNWYQGSRTAIPLPREEVEALVRKWVRGAHLKTVGRVLPKTAVIQVGFREGDDQRSPTHSLGPGIEIMQQVQGRVAEYRFKLWGQFVVYALVHEGEPA